MERMIVRIARNDEFAVVGYSVEANDETLFHKGCTTSEEFYYVKNVSVNAETFAKIISLYEGAKMLERAESDFFYAFKRESIEILNKAAQKKGNEGVNGFNLNIYREPREKMENELNALIASLR